MTGMHYVTRTTDVSTMSETQRPTGGTGGGRRFDGGLHESERVLFVLRESSTTAQKDLAGLALQVLLKHADREGVADLLEAGVEPLVEPRRWNGRHLPMSYGRASLVRVSPVTWAMYVLSSAAKDTDGDQNAFTEASVDVMNEIKPHVVVTGPMGRLVRSPNHSSRVSRALGSHQVVLLCQEGKIDFRMSPDPPSVISPRP